MTIAISGSSLTCIFRSNARYLAIAGESPIN
jgi:hypothetical protein